MAIGHVHVLASAIEAVRHRGLQKRVDELLPDEARPVRANGRDWVPCEVCRDEAELLLTALNERGFKLELDL